MLPKGQKRTKKGFLNEPLFSSKRVYRMRYSAVSGLLLNTVVKISRKEVTLQNGHIERQNDC